MKPKDTDRHFAHSMPDGPSWRERSGWSLGWEIKRWVKAFVGAVPGRMGSFLRRAMYGFGSCGIDVFLAEGFWAEYPRQIEIGDHVGINRDCFINAGGGVVFEEWVLVGPRVMLYTQNHDIQEYSPTPIALRKDIRESVRICHNVWIGAGATVLPGVVVGEHSIVAAGAVVTEDVAPRTVVGGVPAKVLRRLNSSA